MLKVQNNETYPNSTLLRITGDIYVEVVMKEAHVKDLRRYLSLPNLRIEFGNDIVYVYEIKDNETKVVDIFPVNYTITRGDTNDLRM